MKKELKKLMKKNNFHLLRHRKHLVWKHISGVLLTTSCSPSNKKALRNIMKDIKSVTGVCYV